MKLFVSILIMFLICVIEYILSPLARLFAWIERHRPLPIIILLCALCVPVANATLVDLTGPSWAGLIEQPGYTNRLNGTFTNSYPGGTNSGTATQPITLLFATGAKFTAPYWNPAAITLDTVSNIVVDGGANGLIEATANGTGLAYTNRSVGIKINAGYSNTVQNLTVSNMYVRIAGSGENSPDAAYGAFTTGIWLVGGSYINLVNNYISGGEGGVSVQSWGNMSTNHDFNIFGNRIERNCISISFGGSGGTNATFYNLNIVSNRMDHWSEWAAVSPGSSNLHRDGMYLFLAQNLVQDYHVLRVVYPSFPTNYPMTYTTNGITITSSNLARDYFIDASGKNWTNALYAITNSTGVVFTLKTNNVSIASVDMAAGGDGYWRFGFFLGSSIVWGGDASVQSNGLPYVIFASYDINETCTISNVTISHNYVGPDVCAPGTAGGTAAMFMTWYTTNQNFELAFDFRVFNNVLVWTNLSDSQSPWADGFLSANAWGNSIMANNTVISAAFQHGGPFTTYGQGSAMGLPYTKLKIYNNFTLDISHQIAFDVNTLQTNFHTGFYSDYNVFARPASAYIGINIDDFTGPPSTPGASAKQYTWAFSDPSRPRWNTNEFFLGILFDTHSSTNMPLISTTTYQPLTNDTVLIDNGTNLIAWGIVNDFNGNPRPTNGMWTIGAFEGGTNQPFTTYTLTVANGTGSASGLTAGQVVSISTNCTIFVRWTGPGTNYISANTASTSLTMPAADTIITAECTNMILAGNVYIPILIR